MTETNGSGPDGPFVQVHGVSKWFGDLQVLDNVDLEVGEHNVACLIGASGSGKSTLLRCLNLLERVEQGEICIDGQRLTHDLPAHDGAPERDARAAQGARVVA